jgi:hypothetical protein
MKKLILTFVALSLIGCASTHNAASQNYRLKGANENTTITGKIDKKIGFPNIEYDLTVFFNNSPQITAKLDENITGEAEGLDYQGKKTSVNCYSKRVDRNNVNVYCMVFVDNEKTVTLQF